MVVRVEGGGSEGGGSEGGYRGGGDVEVLCITCFALPLV